ncbi:MULTISPECIES: phosphate acyltransferase [unclassified Saccharicrinis]|uniref:phosphate acyltransferase n=1 Tax=unclassified Saccharicrinis TaxID=2646859 RepID=UPI003D3561E2
MEKNISKLEQIPEYVIGLKRKFRVAVVVAEDSNTLDAVLKAAEEKFVFPILMGNSRKISQLLPYDFLEEKEKYDIIECVNEEKTSELAVAMVKRGEADILMKGLINTDLFLKAVLNKENGLLMPESVLSYVCAIELPAYNKLLFLTDPAVLPFPNLQQKVTMANYAIEMAHNMGIKKPRVALIGATEKVSPHFPNSLEYQTMCEMAEKGQIKGCIMDGPLDVFLACDPGSVKIKGIDTPVEGNADILLFPSLEACNPFYKGLMLFGGGELAGLIRGTTHPVVVMSRSESFKSKYYCLALACLMAENNC